MARADPYGGALGRFYSFYIARPAVARSLGRVLWDSDFAPMYASLAQLRALPAGFTVLDVACGAGLALAMARTRRPAPRQHAAARNLAAGRQTHGARPRLHHHGTRRYPGRPRGMVSQSLQGVRVDVHGAMAVFQAVAPSS